MYIGKHTSNTFCEEYLGSGKTLKKALKKYGRENFSKELIVWAKTYEELDNEEKRIIAEYKNKYGRDCYNIAAGGDGGDVYLHNPEEKTKFIKKMTKINRERCSTDEFRKAASKRMIERYSTRESRERHSEMMIEVYRSRPELREAAAEHARKLHKQGQLGPKTEKCVFELKGEKKEFDSVGELKNYLKGEYDYRPSNNDLARMLRERKPYIPFHKNNKKLQKLSGMIIYKK